MLVASPWLVSTTYALLVTATTRILAITTLLGFNAATARVCYFICLKRSLRSVYFGSFLSMGGDVLLQGISRLSQLLGVVPALLLSDCPYFLKNCFAQKGHLNGRC